MRGASVRRTTNYTSQDDNDVVPFDTEEHDDDNLWSSGAPTILGPLPTSYEGCRAQLHAEAIWSGGTTSSYREIKMFRNGDTAAPIAVVQHAPNAHNTGLQCVSRWITVHEDDEFTVCLKSEGDETALTADDYSITFSIAVASVG